MQFIKVYKMFAMLWSVICLASQRRVSRGTSSGHSGVTTEDEDDVDINGGGGGGGGTGSDGGTQSSRGGGGSGKNNPAAFVQKTSESVEPPVLSSGLSTLYRWQPDDVHEQQLLLLRNRKRRRGQLHQEVTSGGGSMDLKRKVFEGEDKQEVDSEWTMSKFRRKSTGFNVHERGGGGGGGTVGGSPDLLNKLRATGDYVPLEEVDEGGGEGEYNDEDLMQRDDGQVNDDDDHGKSTEVEESLQSGNGNVRLAGEINDTGRVAAADGSTSGWSSGATSKDEDIVTTFLHIVESQSILGENCTAGTDLNLGEGVVDRYAQERFRLEAEVAVNRANLLTRLWKYAADTLERAEYLLYAAVRSMVEFDDDIFAAGNCYDRYAYLDYWLFCPFGHRLPEGTILVKDLAVEYKYLSNTSEWFYRARKSAERVIHNFTTFKFGYNVYSSQNGSVHGPRQEDSILSVSYEDGKWSKPYFDCGGGNIWMLTYTVPFFGYTNHSYVFKGTSGIDIDLRRVDIDQCPQRPGSTELNIFAASDKCKKRTTKCEPIPGLGFRRGSYKCVCKDGFYFPLTGIEPRYYNGTYIEEEYEKLIMGEESVYSEPYVFECLRCSEGCEVCVDDRPCVATLNWVLRTSILILATIVSSALPLVAWFTWKYGDLKVVKAASPVLLRIIIIGAFFVYSTILVMYPRPNVYTCTLRVWLREMGFSLSYGALMLKTWRISVIFRVRSAKAVKITDLDLIKRLGFIVGGFAVFLVIRTVVATPHVIVGRTADDLKAFLCSTDWWDHSCTIFEMIFLVWGISLCIVVRKAPSEFNESRFISMAIYNEFLLSVFLNISMIFLQSPANPDLLYIIFFCHSQLTITLLLCLIFGSKAYMVLKGHGKEENGSMFSKPSTTKFVTRPKSQNSAQVAQSSSISTNRAPTDSSGSRLTDSDVQEEFKRLYLQLEILKEKNMKLGNRHLAAKINAMQEAAHQEDLRLEARHRHPVADNVERCTSRSSSPVLPVPLGTSSLPPDVMAQTSTLRRLSSGRHVANGRGMAKPEDEGRGSDGVEDTLTVEGDIEVGADGESVGALHDVAVNGGNGKNGVELRPMVAESPNHVLGMPRMRLDEDSVSTANSIASSQCISEDATVKSAQNSPQGSAGGGSSGGGGGHRARSRRHRRRRIVINLDDKSRFTDEITV